MTDQGATQRDPHSHAVGMLIAGRYRLEAWIGGGGFGSVYRATEQNTRHSVALKLISRRTLELVGGAERFEREVALAKRLEHPNIVRTLDAGSDPNGMLFIAFELLEGRTLENLLEERGALPLGRAATVMVQMLDALEHAHARHVLHRDIKPANIFIGADDIVKVLDFGIAKSTQEGTRAGLTQEGTMLGTPQYMAPEQLLGGTQGPALDLFSAGLVFAAMIDGRSVYPERQSPLAVVEARLSQAQVPLPASVLSSPFGQVIGKAVALDPNHRFSDAASMRTSIEQATQALRFTPEQMQTASSPGTQEAQAVTLAQPRAQTPAQSAAQPPAQPWAQPPAQPWAPATGPAVPKTRSASSAIVFALLGTGLLAGLGAAYLFWARSEGATASEQRKTARAEASDESDEETPSARKRRDKRLAEQERAAAALSAAPLQVPVPPPIPAAPLVTSAPAALARLQTCRGLSSLTEPGLRNALVASGLSVTGVYRLCDGDMINFRCMATEARGFTVKRANSEGTAALARLASSSAADTFAEAQRSGAQRSGAQQERTVAKDAQAVLLLDLPPADADSVLKRLCK